MSVRKKIFQGTGVLMAGEAVAYGLSFVRNLFLARLLTKADFGIAATFGIILSIVEFVGKMGVSRFLIQDKEGDAPQFMATAHTIQFAVSLLSALLILLCAGPLALLFDIHGDLWSLRSLALLPLLRGFEHLDVYRMERSFRFFPSTIVSVVPQLLMTIALWPVARLLPDYRSVLVLLVIKSLCSTVTTFWLAKRDYRWGFNRDYATRIFYFGWPSIMNGFIMFGIFQGDQFLVASLYSMSDLGTFAAATALASAPTFVFAKILSSIMLPLMAQVQGNVPDFARRYRCVIECVCALSIGYAVVTIIASTAIMRITYGEKYADAGILFAWLAAANTLRIVRVAPAIAALAKADSKNQMFSNLWRLSTLPVVFVAAYNSMPLWVIGAISVGGELLATMISFMRLSRRDGVSPSWSLVPTAVTIASILTSALICKLIDHQHPLFTLILAVLTAAIFVCLFSMSFPTIRAHLYELFCDIRSRSIRNSASSIR